jgi:lysozyme family protein
MIMDSKLCQLDVLIASILKHEGGYWQDPIGGNTNHGVRQKYLTKFRKIEPDLPLNVEDLTEGEAAVIYEIFYLSKERGQNVVCLPYPLDLVISHTVVMSWNDGIEILQKLVGTKVDGKIGPNTLRCIKDSGLSASGLAAAVATLFCKRFSSHEFIDGYRNRMTKVIREFI